MVVGDQRAHDWLAGSVVVPDGGGEGQDALDDPGDHAGRGVAAVAFEVELAFEGVVDRFDDLAQRLEELSAAPLGLALAGGAEQDEPGCGEGGFEVVPVVVLVGDDDLPGPRGGQRGIVED